MSTYSGPEFKLVETISFDELEKRGGFFAGDRPLLVKGAVKNWPAWHKWSFELLANLKNKDGSEIIARFQNGLIEQGQTNEPIYQSVNAYLHQLDKQSKNIATGNQNTKGLVDYKRFQTLDKETPFYLNWSYLNSFAPKEAYLAQWRPLEMFPELKNDFAIKKLWDGLRWTWEYVFIGPAQTLTGLHDDFGNNWFCQVRGLKEFVLFTPNENDEYLAVSDKYDWGARLSNVDISRIEQQDVRFSFAKAKGLYTRVEAGDALYIPKRTWHGVVALEPSISIAIFGLTLGEILTDGVKEEFMSITHKLGFHHKNNCACHKMPVVQKPLTLTPSNPVSN